MTTAVAATKAQATALWVDGRQRWVCAWEGVPRLVPEVVERAVGVAGGGTGGCAVSSSPSSPSSLVGVCAGVEDKVTEGWVGLRGWWH
jgi:hypothetical protein